MPHHKNQHYVPKCHMKPFSVGGTGKAINLLNIGSNKAVQNASIRNQCSKSYFYGEDLAIEKRLQAPEGTYAVIVRRIRDGAPVEESAMQFLRDFCYLQYLRTDIATKRNLLAQEEMAALIFEGAPVETWPEPLSQREIARDSINLFSETVHLIQDLKICIMRNNTTRSFITSDDPSVLINRFNAQRLGKGHKSFGIQNSGAMFVLPLSPNYLMFAYDGNVYTCPDNINRIVEVNERDVGALNALQHMKAAENVYFSDWSITNELMEQQESFSKKRPTSWHKVNFAVKEDESGKGEAGRYKVVHTKEERLASKEALVHLEGIMLDPGIWCSKIKFRDKPKFINTNSGAGYLRPTMQT